MQTRAIEIDVGLGGIPSRRLPSKWVLMDLSTLAVGTITYEKSEYQPPLPNAEGVNDSPLDRRASIV